MIPNLKYSVSKGQTLNMLSPSIKIHTDVLKQLGTQHAVAFEDKI